MTQTSFSKRDQFYFLYQALHDHAVDRLCDIRMVEPVLNGLPSQLHKCRAKTPKQFLQWCCRQINKQAAKAEKERAQSKNVKPFEIEAVGDIFHIYIESHGRRHVWKVEDLEFAESLRPVHVRYSHSKPFVARKKSVTLRNGNQKQVIFPAHHALLLKNHFLVEPCDINCSRARNGDFLDWTNDNIYMPALEGLSLSENEREFRIKKAIKESSFRQYNFANGDGYDYRRINDYHRIPVDIDPALVAEWERKLEEGKPGDRDITECGIRDYGIDVENPEALPWYVDGNNNRANFNRPNRLPIQDDEEMSFD